MTGREIDPPPRLYRISRVALQISASPRGRMIPMDVESLERHNENVHRLMAARQDDDARWRKTFISSLHALKREANAGKNTIRVRSENMPLRTFEYREYHRKEIVEEICEALASGGGWSGKVRTAVGKTAASLGCKF